MEEEEEEEEQKKRFFFLARTTYMGTRIPCRVTGFGYR